MKQYPDFHSHLRRLDEAGLLIHVERPINKDTQLHPLVRWQYRGGIPESDRKAFLFHNVIDAKGRSMGMPVAVGALAATARIYGIGLGCEPSEVNSLWQKAKNDPLPPVMVDDHVCQQQVIEGEELTIPGGGLERLPVPISTPGFDTSPYLTCSAVITRDPEDGSINVGNYRGQIKAPNRLGFNISLELGQGITRHWQKARKLGRPLEAAVAIGGPPAFIYAAAQKLPFGMDEFAAAGRLAGEPIRITKARTVDLPVPADADIIIEGRISTEFLELEGAYGESHGYVNLPEEDLFMEVTCITHRNDAIFPSIISQVTPSESSVMKRVAMEPLMLSFLRDTLGIKQVRRVVLHEPLTNLRKVVAVVLAPNTPEAEVWRALQGAANFQTAVGKLVIAVDEDIDPDNSDALLWALSYRMTPHEDIQIIEGRDLGHSPNSVSPYVAEATTHKLDSALLINATLRGPLPPVSLPTRRYMEEAKEIWEELGLPALKPESPWYGYSLGDWNDELQKYADRAVRGETALTGEEFAQKRVRPEELGG